MPQLPTPVLSDAHKDQDFNKLVAFAKSLRPMRGVGVSTTHTIFGVARKAARAKRVGAKPQPSGNWNYRGMYDPAATYMQFDVVQMGNGSSAGMYLSLLDNNQYAPDSGIGWVQVSTGSGNFL